MWTNNVGVINKMACLIEGGANNLVFPFPLNFFSVRKTRYLCIKWMFYLYLTSLARAPCANTETRSGWYNCTLGKGLGSDQLAAPCLHAHWLSQSLVHGSSPQLLISHCLDSVYASWKSPGYMELTTKYGILKVPRLQLQNSFWLE